MLMLEDAHTYRLSQSAPVEEKVGLAICFGQPRGPEGPGAQVNP